MRLFDNLFRSWKILSLAALISLGMAGSAQADPFRPARRPAPAAVAKPAGPATGINRVALNPQPLPPRGQLPSWRAPPGAPRFGMWGFQNSGIHPQPQPNLPQPIIPQNNRAILVR